MKPGLEPANRHRKPMIKAVVEKTKGINARALILNRAEFEFWSNGRAL
jgi:hypothetical protein